MAGDADRRAIGIASVSDRAEPSVAMVTGASCSIGAATARLLAHQVYRLALRLRSGCQRLAAELHAWSFAGSLTEKSDLKGFVRDTIAQCGLLDAEVSSTDRYASILNNLEITPAPSISLEGFRFEPEIKPDLFAITREAWQKTVDLLVDGTVSTAKFTTPHPLGREAAQSSRYRAWRPSGQGSGTCLVLRAQPITASRVFTPPETLHRPYARTACFLG